MQVEFASVVASVAVSVFTVIIAFFIKGYLAECGEYKKLRRKLETIAGKNATIVYSGAGNVGGTLYKITHIGKEGIFIENPVHKIFLPSSVVLHLPMILPVDDYKTLKDEYEKEEIERVSSAMFEPLFEKIEENFEESVAKPNSEISTSIEARVIYILKEQGLLVAQPHLGEMQISSEKRYDAIEDDK